MLVLVQEEELFLLQVIEYTYIPVEDDKFTDGEDMTSPNATFKIVSGGLVEGATNITDNFDLR